MNPHDIQLEPKLAEALKHSFDDVQFQRVRKARGNAIQIDVEGIRAFVYVDTGEISVLVIQQRIQSLDDLMVHVTRLSGLSGLLRNVTGSLKDRSKRRAR